jgi:cytochrome c oxidase subunit 3
MQPTTPQSLHDESPIDLRGLRDRLPGWLKRLLPSGGGYQDDHLGINLFGMLTFLVSESFIFLAFIAAYFVSRTSPDWLPAGVTGVQLGLSTLLVTLLLVLSSIMILGAERLFARRHFQQSRMMWLATIVIGIIFLVNELLEWNGLDFEITTGLLGGFYYLMTGFHGLHFVVGIGLLLWITLRAYTAETYRKQHFGVIAVSLFWHFLVLTWLVMFLVLYLL